MHSRALCVLAALFSLPCLTPAATPEYNSTRPALVVNHGPDEGAWSVAETDHFRFYHHHSQAYITRVARIAEQTRDRVLRKWFAAPDEVWDSRCELYLYASARDYATQTGAPMNSPGHTRIKDDRDRILGREIHLHVAAPDFLWTILPHEVTHAVLAGHFGAHRIPKWADEGMAVLSESSDRIGDHLRDLPHWRDDGMLFTARDLLDQSDYPAMPRVGAFYSQSVSLVRFLAGVKGPRVFTRFVQDGLEQGYAESLWRNYGWDYSELQRRWLQHAFSDDAEAHR